MPRLMRVLLRDERGGPLAEFALVIGLLFVVGIFIFEMTRFSMRGGDGGVRDPSGGAHRRGAPADLSRRARVQRAGERQHGALRHDVLRRLGAVRGGGDADLSRYRRQCR